MIEKMKRATAYISSKNLSCFFVYIAPPNFTEFQEFQTDRKNLAK